MVESIGCVVIGAGVVGLAVARAIALQGREVMVLEQADAIGTGTSSRNSEVIHAGIYYAQHSLKAELCVQGKEMLYAYCDERGVAYQRCGKLIVATSVEQIPELEAIRLKAAANGVNDLVHFSREQAQKLEPELACEAALHSPSTGIVDSHGLMLALQGDLENAGGMVAFHAKLSSAVLQPDGAWLVTTEDGTQLETPLLVNAAGYAAPELARSFDGLPAVHVPTAFYAKGNYFVLSGRAPFKHLIYPVPEAAGLGVHLTLDMGGQAKFGPDVEWVDDPDFLQVNPERGSSFYKEVRRFWPSLPDGALLPGYAGIRPKISAPNDATADFCIQGPQQHGVAGLINLFGIESPGLTSCLAIAERVARMGPAV